MQTTVTELPDSRVRVEVEVPAGRRRSPRQPRRPQPSAREMRLPGFRKGKVPPELVHPAARLRRRCSSRRSATRSPSGTSRRSSTPAVSPVGDPEIEITSAPEDEGQPLGFKFEVGVRPRAELGEYKGLEVGRAEPEVPDDIIDREIERIRESMARLEPVERAAAEGDVLLIDFAGTHRRRAVRGRATATTSCSSSAPAS